MLAKGALTTKQCWLRSKTIWGIIRPQWFNGMHCRDGCCQFQSSTTRWFAPNYTQSKGLGVVVYGDDRGGGDRFCQFLGGKKIICMLKMGGFRNGTQQELNKMVDMVQFGGQKDCSDVKNGGGGGGGGGCKTVTHTYWLSMYWADLEAKVTVFNHCCLLVSYGFVGLYNHVFRPLLQPILTN